ncbi:MAG: SDR family NAD(P)-dependent oxidoreductase, partial [bacterium]|nr:SDR family NAD(P)-dependent oxidoreductase [bacterium]
FMQLENKIALVTGAGSGIGKAIAIEMAREGAHIAINDLTEQSAEETARRVEALGQKALVLPADVSNSAQVNTMVDKTLSTFGKIDILVNNAGTYVPHEGGIVNLPDEAWQKTLNVNLNGPFYGCRAVAKNMIERKEGGKIINISSVQAEVAHFDASAYQPSKAALVMLTRSLAVELAPYKINVNAIGPGAIASEGLGGIHGPEIVEAYRKRIPWGARGHTRDIGTVAVFLASEASRYMTGQILYVDGGYLSDSTPTELKSYNHPVPPDDPDPK